VEFACGRTGDDGDLTAAQLSRAALRPLSRLATRAGRQLVCLHGTGNRSPTCRSGGVRAPRSRNMVCLAPYLEAETACANEQLVVQGGDSSEGVLLVGN
jgi:hypothetical protein